MLVELVLEKDFVLVLDTRVLEDTPTGVGLHCLSCHQNSSPGCLLRNIQVPHRANGCLTRSSAGEFTKYSVGFFKGFSVRRSINNLVVQIVINNSVLILDKLVLEDPSV